MDPAEMLARGFSRETSIRRDARGQWFDGDEPITHPRMIEAFDRWIDRAPDGRYCLKNAIHWVYVGIEGAPLFVRSARIHAEGVELTLSDGAVERLDPATLREGPDGALYCDARGGTMPASFERKAAFMLGDVLAEDESGLYLLIRGEKVRPPRVSDPLVPRSQA